jgi:hypothetical protein
LNLNSKVVGHGKDFYISPGGSIMYMGLLSKYVKFHFNATFYTTTAGLQCEFRIYRNGVYQPGTKVVGSSATTASGLNTVSRDFIGEAMDNRDDIQVYIFVLGAPVEPVHIVQFSLSGFTLSNALRLPAVVSNTDPTPSSTQPSNSGQVTYDLSPDFLYDTLNAFDNQLNIFTGHSIIII